MPHATDTTASTRRPAIRARVTTCALIVAVLLGLTPTQPSRAAAAQPEGVATAGVTPGGQVDSVVGVLKTGRSWSEVLVIKDLGSTGKLNDGWEFLVGLRKFTTVKAGGVYRVTARNVSASQTCEKNLCWTDHLEVTSATRVTGSCRETTYRKKFRLKADTRATVTICVNPYGVQASLGVIRGTQNNSLRGLDLVVERFTSGNSVLVSSPVQVNLQQGVLTSVVAVDRPESAKSCAARITGLMDVAHDGEDMLPAGSKTFRC